MGHSDKMIARVLINNRFCSFVPSQTESMANDETTEIHNVELAYIYTVSRKKRKEDEKKWRDISKEPANELAIAVATNCRMATIFI